MTTYTSHCSLVGTIALWLLALVQIGVASISSSPLSLSLNRIVPHPPLSSPLASHSFTSLHASLPSLPTTTTCTVHLSPKHSSPFLPRLSPLPSFALLPTPSNALSRHTTLLFNTLH